MRIDVWSLPCGEPDVKLWIGRRQKEFKICLVLSYTIDSTHNIGSDSELHYKLYRLKHRL